jgi:hypothetical protein
MCASLSGEIDVARVLVQAGAEINNRASNLTPLGCAAFHGHTSMVKELLLWGAVPSLVGTFQKTACQAAMRGGHHETAQLLGAWGSIQAVWVVRSADQVRRVGKNSALERFPKDLVRMVWGMLV